MSNFFYNIGIWIRNTYYWFLWNAGFPDSDGDYSTIYDRVPITQMLRNTKMRLGYLWWVLSLGTLIIVHTFCVIVSPWYWFLMAFFIWLFVHVMETARFPEERRRHRRKNK
jgi:hypothetical protein